MNYSHNQGITLLLTIIILSALLSIGLGIFTVVFEEFRISGETADSYTAFYAADHALERVLYKDRKQGNLCSGTGINCYTEGVPTPVNLPSGGCYTVTVSKTGGDTTLRAIGQYRCGITPVRIVKRGFEVSY